MRRDALGFLLGKVIRMHHQRIRQVLEGFGLHRGQPPIMFELWESDGLSQKHFSEVTGLAPATVTVMLKRMEKAGLLTRRKDDTDRRISRVYLTEYGKALQTRVEEAIEMVEADMEQSLSDEEVREAKRLLRKLEENLAMKFEPTKRR